MVCEGSIISSATLRRVLLGYDCFVHAGSVVEDSIVRSGCDIGAGARLRRVMLDKNCKAEPGTAIGEDLEQDRARLPLLSDAGMVGLPRGTVAPRTEPLRLQPGGCALL